MSYGKPPMQTAFTKRVGPSRRLPEEQQQKPTSYHARETETRCTLAALFDSSSSGWRVIRGHPELNIVQHTATTLELVGRHLRLYDCEGAKISSVRRHPAFDQEAVFLVLKGLCAYPLSAQEAVDAFEARRAASSLLLFALVARARRAASSGSCGLGGRPGGSARAPLS
eukprot:2677501-Pleurochrysis_carterae.AAC.1